MGSQFAGGFPAIPPGGLPPGTVPGQVLTWNGTDWVAGALPPASPLLRVVPLPVNAAGVNGIGYNNAQAVCLRTGLRVNATGSFNGGGVGNKAVCGVSGYNGMPIGALTSVKYVWTSQLGPKGLNAAPPELTTTVTPYLNMIVDFNPPPGPGDLRVLVGCTDQLPVVAPFLGTYFNNGSNVFTYEWTSAFGVLIVQSGIGPGPGVPPVIPAPAGPAWQDNVYSWAALVASNPTAVLVDAFPATTMAPGGDGGMPVGATVPAIVIASGDSGTVIKSGKVLQSLDVNGLPVWPIP